MADTKSMRFVTFGRSYHLRIGSAEQLDQAARLDGALWVATSAPVSTLHCDPDLAGYVDSGHSGRITCRDLRQAIGWTLTVLAETSGLEAHSDQIRLDQIDPSSRDGQRIAEALQKILDRLEAGADAPVSLANVRQVKAREESLPISEAGVILPEASDDPDIRRFLQHVGTAVGGPDHPSGQPGVSEDSLRRFAQAAEEVLSWHRAGQIRPDGEATEIQPLGEETAEAWDALAGLTAKLDQYFAQCEAVALDERFSVRMGWTETELAGMDFDNPEAIRHVLASAPLARARADRTLDLQDRINPYYRQELETAVAKAIAPVVGTVPAALTAVQWLGVKQFYQAHRQWRQNHPDPAVAEIGVATLEEYQDPRFARAARDLLAQSDRRTLVMDNLRLAEKLLLYQRDLIQLANNIVSFPHLYDPGDRAMLEMGTLIMDGRRFNLAVKVENRAEHVTAARAANIFVIYAEIQPPHGAAPYEVACPVVWGDKGNLVLGKRGIFHDVQGRECQARLVHIIENPVSVLEALAMPFKRIAQMITGKIESIASSAEKDFDARATGAINQVPVAQQGQAPPAPGPGPQRSSPGMLVGAGVAIAALGSMAAYVTKTLAGIGWLGILYGLIGAILLVMIPISLVAILKLRRRDLSAILEGSGWAINARMRLTRRQKRFFTRRPAYPSGSRGTHRLLWIRLAWLGLLAAILTAAALLARRL